jgi:hypothetical protein
MANAPKLANHPPREGFRREKKIGARIDFTRMAGKVLSGTNYRLCRLRNCETF